MGLGAFEPQSRSPPFTSLDALVQRHHGASLLGVRKVMRECGDCADEMNARDGARNVVPTVLALDLEATGLANVLAGLEVRVDGRGVMCS